MFLLILLKGSQIALKYVSKLSVIVFLHIRNGLWNPSIEALGK